LPKINAAHCIYVVHVTSNSIKLLVGLQAVASLSKNVKNLKTYYIIN